MWRQAQLRNKLTRGPSNALMRRRGALLHRGMWFEGREVRDKAAARGSSHRSDEATDLGIEHPTVDQEAICRLAYFFVVSSTRRTRRSSVFLRFTRALFSGRSTAILIDPGVSHAFGADGVDG